jgi:methylmalonyl-CoA/ethylmalonyl-CoA epimerase
MDEALNFPIQRIEHVGIAVADLAAANKLYTALLGVGPYKSEQVAREGVETSFFAVGESKIELLQALNESSAIAKFIDKKGEGIHHIAFGVADIKKEMARLKGEGFQLLSDEPMPGADNKWVCFVHPKSAYGVLIELCQERKDADLP